MLYRHWAACAALGTIFLLGCPPQPTPSAELRFLNQGNVVKTEATISAATYNATLLNPVPDIPLLGFWNGGLGGVTVDIFGEYSLAPVDSLGLQGQQIEAHLFTSDLANLNSYFRSTNAGLSVNVWDARSNAGASGGDVVLPYPPNAQWNLSNRYGAFLLPVYFWPNVGPDTPAADPNGYGSVKSARLHKAGLCSADVPFTGGIAPILDACSNNFFSSLFFDNSICFLFSLL